MNHLMIDLETLSTENNAAIVQLGWVLFSPAVPPAKWPGAQYKVNPQWYTDQSNSSYYHISASTLQWWDEQDPEVRADVMSGTQSLPQVLNTFVGDLTATLFDVGCPMGELEVWAKDPDFDCTILKTAMELDNVDGYLFGFRQHRAVRTAESLVPKAIFTDIPPNPAKHNAFEDAKYQARRIACVLGYLEGLKT